MVTTDTGAKGIILNKVHIVQWNGSIPNHSKFWEEHHHPQNLKEHALCRTPHRGASDEFLPDRRLLQVLRHRPCPCSPRHQHHHCSSRCKAEQRGWRQWISFHYSPGWTLRTILLWNTLPLPPAVPAPLPPHNEPAASHRSPISFLLPLHRSTLLHSSACLLWVQHNRSSNTEKDCLFTGQEQACSRITWLFGCLFVTMPKMAEYTVISGF